MRHKFSWAVLFSTSKAHSPYHIFNFKTSIPSWSRTPIPLFHPSVSSTSWIASFSSFCLNIPSSWMPTETILHYHSPFSSVTEEWCSAPSSLRVQITPRGYIPNTCFPPKCNPLYNNHSSLWKVIIQLSDCIFFSGVLLLSYIIEIQNTCLVLVHYLQQAKRLFTTPYFQKMKTDSCFESWNSCQAICR